MILAKTKNGGDPSVLSSAIQKCIRRGNEKLAFTYCFEMGQSSKAYFTWMTNRLLTIAYEDVGIGSMEAVNYAMHGLDAMKYFKDKGKEDAWPTVLANVILALCRAEKTRVGVHLECVCVHELEEKGLPELPDECLDMHTHQGKKMGRGIDHFLAEGAKLVPAVECAKIGGDPYKEQAEEIWRKTYRTGADRKKAERAAKEEADTCGSPDLF